MLARAVRLSATSLRGAVYRCQHTAAITAATANTPVSDMVATYRTDGYLLVRSLFSPREMDMLRDTIATDTGASSHRIDMQDGAGRSSGMTLWQHIIPDTMYGLLAASSRMRGIVAPLLGGAFYHLHTKLMLKQPRTGGQWVVHQDFAYWYQAGAVDPHGMMSCIIAVDGADEGNGCLQFLRGSHVLGRLQHGVEGEQAGADADVVRAARDRFPVVMGELRPGDVLLTHSNLIHWSGPNTSDRWRRAMIVAYNRMDNPPVRGGMGVLPMPIAMPPPAAGDDVCALGPRGLGSVAADAMARAAFLRHETNVDYVSKGRGR